MGLPHGAFHGLMKRGMHAVNCHMKQKMTEMNPTGEPPSSDEKPVWGMALICMTFIFFVAFYAAMQYTLQIVVATLTMVETPTSAITIVAPIDPEDPDAPLDKEEKEPFLQSQNTITIHKPKPITAKIRTTIKHIHSIDGFTGRWRGLRTSILYNLFTGLLSWLLMGLFGRFPGGMELTTIITNVVFAHIHMAWTHAIIAMPNSKPFYKRFCTPCSVSRQLWAPAAINTLANLAAIHLMKGIALILGLHGHEMEGISGWGIVWRIAVFLIVSFISVLFIILPADVTLARIEASLLPAEEDTVVPFDRTFGGKVEPAVVGGRKAVPFLEAWRSFNWEARRRLIKLHVKIFLISITFILFAVHVLGFLTWAIFGNQMHDLIRKMYQHAQERGLVE